MTFESLKNAVESKKIELAKMEVRLQQLKSVLIKEFGTDDIEQVKKKLEEMKEDLETSRKQYADELRVAEDALSKLDIR